MLRVSQLIAALSLLTIPLIVLGLKGKLFTARITDENGCAINAMLEVAEPSNDAAEGDKTEEETKAQEESEDGKDN